MEKNAINPTLTLSRLVAIRFPLAFTFLTPSYHFLVAIIPSFFYVAKSRSE